MSSPKNGIALRNYYEEQIINKTNQLVERIHEETGEIEKKIDEKKRNLKAVEKKLSRVEKDLLYETNPTQKDLYEYNASKERESIQKISGDLEDLDKKKNEIPEKIQRDIDAEIAELNKRISDLDRNKISDKQDLGSVKTDNSESIEDLGEPDTSSAHPLSEDNDPRKDESAKELFGNRTPEGGAEAAIDEEDTDNFLELKNLFQEGREIENALIYVATFFEGLSTNEFNEVVSSLLKNKITYVISQEEVLTKKGKVKIPEEREEKRALEVWRQSLSQPDVFLKKCKLKSAEVGETRVIDFDPPTIRSAMKHYLKENQPLYIDELVEKTKLFMFHRRTQVAKGGLMILTDAMLTHPDIYNEDWLLKIVETLTPPDSTDVSYELTLFQKLQILVGKFDLEQIEVSQFAPASNTEGVYARIAGLIYFMLGNQSLQPTVRQFLRMLMEKKQYLVVSEIVNHLDNIDEFDSLYWIKRLLEVNGGEATSQAYNILYRKLKISGFKIYEILEELYEWLPGTGYHSPSSKAALSILVDYCSNTVSAFPEDQYGLYESKYLLFQSFYKGGVDKKFHILISWLFYPGKDNTLAIEDILKDDIDPMEFLGSLLAEWFMILSGFQNEFPSENESHIEIMLNKVVEILEYREDRQIELAQFWKDLSGYYLYKINRLPKANGPEMRKVLKGLTKRRNAIRKLNKQFKLTRKAFPSKVVS